MPVCASTTANKNAMVACEDLPPHSGLVQQDRQRPVEALRLRQALVEPDPAGARLLLTETGGYRLAP